MRQALACIKNKTQAHLLPNGKTVTIRNATEYFGVPKSTLNERVKGKYLIDNPSTFGWKPAFSKTELVEIVTHLLHMSDIGYGYSPLQTMNLLSYLATRYKDKPGFQASRKFLTQIFQEFPEITLRKVCAYQFSKAKSVTVAIVEQFFEILETGYSLAKELSNQKIDPRNIWSLDEVAELVINYFI